MPPRLYAAIVVALAVLFGGLLIGRVPVTGYFVTSEVGVADGDLSLLLQQGGGGRQAGEESHGRDQQLVADAMRAADRQVYGDGGDCMSDAVSAARIREMLTRLNVKTHAGPGETTRIQIFFRGAEPQWSVAFVDQLAREMLAQPTQGVARHPAVARAIRNARWRLEQLRHYERKARFDLEAALNFHFEQLSATGYFAPRQLADAPYPDDRLAVAPAVPVERRINPVWESLQDTMLYLTEELNELLKTVTPNHPRVRDVTLQLEELRRQADATPRFVEDHTRNARTSAAGPLPREQSAANAGATTSNTVYTVRAIPSMEASTLVPATDVQRIRALTAQHAQAIAQREAVEQEVARLELGSQGELNRSAAAGGEIIRPAAVLQQIGGRPPAGSVLLIGLLAAVSGAAMAWRIASLRGLCRIATVDDLRRTLALPVVGQVSIDPVSIHAIRLEWWERLVRWSTRFCEALLGAMVVLFLVSLIKSSPAWREIVQNPLGTFIHMVADACGGWL